MVDQGYACDACGKRAAVQLAEIADLAPEARDVARRLARHGADGGGQSKPGSRPLIDFGATERLGSIENDLQGWVRVVAEARGSDAVYGTAPTRAVPDGLAYAAAVLVDQVGWLRHQQFADEVLDAIAQSAHKVAAIVNGPTPGRYAGPCSAIVDDPDAPCPVSCACHNGPHYACTEPGGCGSAGCGRRQCGQDVTARPGASYGTCKACGAEYDVDEQQAWMRGEIEGYLARPVEIAGVLLRLGFPIGYSTIAAYAAKGQLVARGRDEQDRPLFRIGDVMTLRMGAKKR